MYSYYTYIHKIDTKNKPKLEPRKKDGALYVPHRHIRSFKH